MEDKKAINIRKKTHPRNHFHAVYCILQKTRSSNNVSWTGNEMKILINKKKRRSAMPAFSSFSYDWQLYLSDIASQLALCSSGMCIKLAILLRAAYTLLAAVKLGFQLLLYYKLSRPSVLWRQFLCYELSFFFFLFFQKKILFFLFTSEFFLPLLLQVSFCQ